MPYDTEIVVGSCVVRRQSRKSLQGSGCESVSMQQACCGQESAGGSRQCRVLADTMQSRVAPA